MDHNSTIIDSRGENKQKKHGSFIYLIFAAVCSVVLWFYVAGVDTDMAEKKFTGLPIDLENAQMMKDEHGFSVLSGYSMTADITVSGRKSDIGRLKATDVVVFADLSGVTEAGENKLTVQTALPDGMTLSSCYPQSITVYADETNTKPLTVEVQVVSMSKASDLELSEPRLDKKTVNVTGPSKLLERIAKATVSLDLGTVTSSFDITGGIALSDAEGNPVESPYIKTDATEVTASYSVYKTKYLPLSVDFLNGYLASDDVNVKITPASLRVKGEPELIDSLATLSIRQFDETVLTDPSVDVMLAAQSLTLPEGVTLDDAEAMAQGVHVQLRLLNSSKQIPVMLSGPQVQVTAPAGMTYSFNQEILMIEMRGDAATLEAQQGADLKLSVDLSTFTTEGIKTSVPVKVEFNSGSACYVVGEYHLNMTLSSLEKSAVPQIQSFLF